MAKFVAISGPAQTGKTSLVDYLSIYPETSGVVFSPDLYNTVWSNLVDQGIFSSYDEIVRDSDFICVYLIKVLEYYEEYLEKYKDTDHLVFLDCCWVDLLTYSMVSMWCSRAILDLQAEMIERIVKFRDSVDRIYITEYDESKVVKQKFRSDHKIYSVKGNRTIELQYYEVFKNLKNAIALDTSDQTEAALFIIRDLQNLGYL